MFLSPPPQNSTFRIVTNILFIIKFVLITHRNGLVPLLYGLFNLKMAVLHSLRIFEANK